MLFLRGVLLVLDDIVIELALKPPDWHDPPVPITDEFREVRVVTGELTLSLLAEHPPAVAWIAAYYIFELLSAVFAIFKHGGPPANLRQKSNSEAVPWGS